MISAPTIRVRCLPHSRVATDQAACSWCRFAILQLMSCALLTGCSCQEFVSVTNDTESALLVQLALPWPAYGVASGRGCHFEFDLPPHATWTTSDAAREDVTSLDIKPNGVTVIRFWPKGSTAAWMVFSADTGDWAALRIRSHDGELTVVGHDRVERQISLEAATFDWFYE